LYDLTLVLVFEEQDHHQTSSKLMWWIKIEVVTMMDFLQYLMQYFTVCRDGCNSNGWLCKECFGMYEELRARLLYKLNYGPRNSNNWHFVVVIVNNNGTQTVDIVSTTYIIDNNMNQIMYFLFDNILRTLIIDHSNDHGQIWVTRMEDDVYFNSKYATTLFVF
jgi:hypothetical protein